MNLKIITLLVFITITLLSCIQPTLDLKRFTNKLSNQVWLHKDIMVIDKRPNSFIDPVDLIANNEVLFHELNFQLSQLYKFPNSCACIFDTIIYLPEVENNRICYTNQCHPQELMSGSFVKSVLDLKSICLVQKFGLTAACQTFKDEFHCCSLLSSLPSNNVDATKIYPVWKKSLDFRQRKITDSKEKIFLRRTYLNNDVVTKWKSKTNSLIIAVFLLKIMCIGFVACYEFLKEIVKLLLKESTSEEILEGVGQAEDADEIVYDSFEMQINNFNNLLRQINSSISNNNKKVELNKTLTKINSNHKSFMEQNDPHLNFQGNHYKILQSSVSNRDENYNMSGATTEMREYTRSFLHFSNSLCSPNHNNNNNATPKSHSNMMGNFDIVHDGKYKTDMLKTVGGDHGSKYFQETIDNTIKYVERVYNKYHPPGGPKVNVHNCPVYDCQVCTRLLQLTCKMLSSAHTNELIKAAARLLVKANALHIITHETKPGMAELDVKDPNSISRLSPKWKESPRVSKSPKTITDSNPFSKSPQSTLHTPHDDVHTENSEIVYSARKNPQGISSIIDDSEKLYNDIKNSTNEINELCQNLKTGYSFPGTLSECSDCPKLTHVTRNIMEQRENNKDVLFSVGRLLEKTNILHVSKHRQFSSNQNQGYANKNTLAPVKEAPQKSSSENTAYINAIETIDRIKNNYTTENKLNNGNANNLEAEYSNSLSCVVERLNKRAIQKQNFKHEEK